MGDIQIDITARNDAPVNLAGIPARHLLNEDVLSSIDLSALEIYDVDALGSSVTVKLTTSSGGHLSATPSPFITAVGSGTTSLELSGSIHGLNAYLDTVGNVQYQHAIANTYGVSADAVSISVNDNGSLGIGGGIDVLLGSFAIDLLGLNDAPVDLGETFITDEDTAITVAVLANASDPEGDSLQPVLISGPSFGTLAETNGVFLYTPNPNAFGTDRFVYRVSDGAAVSAESTATIAVSPVNDSPVAASDTYSGLAFESLFVNAASGLLSNDGDVEGDPLTVVFFDGTFDGSLTLNPDGAFTYLPGETSFEDVTFRYVAFDGTTQSEPTTVTLSFTATAGTQDNSTRPRDVESKDDMENELIDVSVGSPLPIGALPADSAETGSTLTSQPKTIPLLFESAKDERIQFKRVATGVATEQALSDPPYSFSKLAAEPGIQLNEIDYRISKVQYDYSTFEQEIEERQEATELFGGAVSTLFIGVTAGAALWMTSSSVLLAFVSSALPAWAGFDPIFVVASASGKKTLDDQSLSDLVSQRRQPEELLKKSTET